MKDRMCFAHGLLTDLLNPKVALFYLTFLFMPGRAPVLARSLLPGSVLMGMGFVWLSIYAGLVARLSVLLARDPGRRSLPPITGTVLGGPGLRLALGRW